MSDVHNHEHAKENKGVGPANSLRTVIGVIVSIIAVCLVMFAIFRVYSNELSDEFYDLASVSMDDYTAAQKVEVESFISEVSSVISTMCVLAESPDIDPSGSTFAAYLEEWNQQGSFQVTYTPIEELEQGVASNRNERDEETLRHLYAGETVVSDVRKSNRLNGYYFSIAKPVNRDGRVVGVLRSIVKAEKLLDTSQASSQVTLLGTLLIKEDGTVVPVSKEFEGYEGSTLYQVLEGRGVSSDQIADVRASIENERDVATVMLGKQNGYMTFLTSIRLDVNDWTIVNFTQESSLVEHSESILRLTVYTAALLIVISAAACLAVALVVGRIRKRARRSAERSEVLAEFFDTVLFEYSYPRDTLELTPNARGMFSLSSLSAEGYLAKGIPLIDFLEDDYKRVRMAFENPAPPNELRTITCRARVLSGEYRWFSFTCRYLYEGSQPYMAVGKIVDITKQRETEELLTRKSQMDGLTKTFNKMAFQEKMAALLPETGRGLLFVIDMDRFKQVNDEYGHSMGDRVLEEVARSLLDVFRHRDPVGRVGGDEFVAFLVGANDDAVIEAKREALSSLIAEASRSLGVPIALSVGVALSSGWRYLSGAVRRGRSGHVRREERGPRRGFGLGPSGRVAVRVLRLPAPSVGAHAVEVVLRDPAQLVARFVAGRVVYSYVARATRLDLVGPLASAGALEGMYHVQHAGARAGSQIENAHAATRAVRCRFARHGAGRFRFAGAHFAAHPVERRHVAARKVHHVDVVAHAGAVVRGIVVAEHADAFQLAYGHLRNVGQQVVGDALGILADQAALVRADGVEIAQQHNVPFVVAHVQVGQHLLQHGLRPAVGIRGVVLRAILGDGDELRLAVHRGARREHEVLHAVRAGHVAQGQRAREVIPVVFQRLLHAFAHGLEAGEVDDGVHVVLGEDAVERRAIEDVRLVEFQAVVVCRQAGDLSHPVKRELARVAQVVHNDHVVALIQQFDAGVTSDEPGSARYEHADIGMILGQALVRH